MRNLLTCCRPSLQEDDVCGDRIILAVMDFEDAPDSPFSHPGNKGTSYFAYLDSAKVCSIGRLKVSLPEACPEELSMSTVLALTTAAALVEVHARQGKDAMYMWQTAQAVSGHSNKPS